MCVAKNARVHIAGLFVPARCLLRMLKPYRLRVEGAAQSWVMGRDAQRFPARRPSEWIFGASLLPGKPSNGVLARDAHVHFCDAAFVARVSAWSPTAAEQSVVLLRRIAG